MGVEVAVEVHADEAPELQEAGIDLAHEAGLRKRHARDHAGAEPLDAVLFGELVHPCRIDAGIDRAAHQRHRVRNVGIVLRLHARDRGHHRHRRLADRDHVAIAAEPVQNADQIVDVIVEIETAGRGRHHARIRPVGDVDVVIGQERLDRAAQERGVMARHRRHDQNARLRPPRRVFELALEMEKLAERPLPHARNMDRHALAADQRGVDSPFRLAVAPRRALEHFRRGGDRFAEGRLREGVQRILEVELGDVRHRARGREPRLAPFIHPVKRSRENRRAAGQFGNFSEDADRHGCSQPKPPLRRSISVVNSS